MIEWIKFFKLKDEKSKKIKPNIQLRIGLVGLGRISEHQLKALQELPSFF